MKTEAFRDEISYYKKIRPGLLKKHEGQFALIKKRRLMAVYSSFQEAYQAGVKEFGSEPFFIKQILKEEPVHHLPALTHHLIHAHL